MWKGNSFEGFESLESYSYVSSYHITSMNLHHFEVDEQPNHFLTHLPY